MSLESRTQKVLKLSVNDQPVLLRAPESVAAEQAQQADDIVTQAKQAAERIRRAALEVAQQERTKAQEEAEQIRRETAQQRDQILEELRQQALQEALDELQTEWRPRIEAVANQLEDLIVSGAQALNNALASHRQEIVMLATDMAQAILKRQTPQEEELAQRTLTAVLEQLRDRSVLKVRINRQDLESLEHFEQDLRARFENIQTIDFQPDDRVDRGGVWVEAPSGIVDARIRTQLAEMMETVLPQTERGLADQEEDRSESTDNDTEQEDDFD